MFFSWYKKFSSQPHQPFFTSGILFLILFMALFVSVYSNTLILDNSVLTYHAYTMVFVIFIQFFLGFLFVVFPRFLIQAEIEIQVYMKQFLLYFFASLGIFLTLIFYSKATFIFQILMLIAQIMSFKLLYSIHKKSIVKIKEDTKWVLISLFSGLVFHSLFIISSLNFPYSYELSRFAIDGGFYLFLFMIIFAISQRMIPFFTTAKVPSYVANKSVNLLTILFSLLAFKVILLSFDNAKINLLADIPLFIVITRELIKWKLPFFKSPAIMWVLYLGLYWIPVAFFVSIIEGLMAFYDPNIIFEKAVIHTMALGYFLTVLIGFGTRVILGHSGTTPHASNFAIFIFVVVQFIALLRIFSSFSFNFGLNYTFFINLTAILLIIGLLVWSSKYITILLKGK
ncbi:NnrS family protein [Arcobacter caeni]|uniref:Beta-carotene 15,15'-monooxygenase n=1 Tax=Arcobacter caeni TaxID=1912877 RepID=A0A363CYP7_9BACT|nr:NnrS family protein [Arcobacter caeni]PUE64182.1 beta-carotene 15,15'-monooxygenase [Arcobacter caeni]